MGQLAAQILLRQLAGSAGYVPTHEVPPTELLLRGSTEGAAVLADAERERARPADLAR
jgi:hypothetical protein